MRKGHLAIIEKSKTLGFSSRQMEVIAASDDLTLDGLRLFVPLFSEINKQYAEQAEMFTGLILTLMALFDYGWEKERPLRKLYSGILPQNPSAEDFEYMIQITKRYRQEGISPYKVSSYWDILLFMHRESYPKFCMDYIVKTIFNSSPLSPISDDRCLLEALKSVLGDDFKNNQKDSFLYWFWGKDPNPLSTYYARSYFNLFYDLEAHAFTVNPKDFYQKEVRENVIGQEEDVLILNKEKLRNAHFDRLPFFSTIHQYALENYSRTFEEKKLCYQKVFYYKSDFEKRLTEAHKSLQTSLEVDEKFDEIEVDFTVSGVSFIKISWGNKVKISQGNDGCTYINRKSSASVRIMMTQDEKIFIKKNDRCYIPMNVSDFYEFYEKHTSGLHDFFEMLLSCYTKRSFLLKDILSDMHVSTNIRVPFVINDVVSYHNKRQFITESFRASRQIPVRWNKRNIILSWLIIHSWNNVSDDRSRQILMQCKDTEILSGLSGSIRSGLCDQFLASVITNRIQNIIAAEQKRRNKQQMEQRSRNKEDLALIGSGVLDEEVQEYLGNDVPHEDVLNEAKITANDYVTMCRKPRNPNNRRSPKGKVNLDIKSYAQLNNRHDHFTQDHTNYDKATGSVNVPKNSHFNALRTYLPETFEWITDRKRLILETEIQHHCVWSYAEKISRDDCAIYSYVDQEAKYGDVSKRYTIEFRRDKDDKYYVAQVQGRYDRVNANNMRQHIQELLDQYQTG